MEMSTAVSDGPAFKGHLQLVDNQVNAKSGTVRVRAVFENAEGRLMPGQFAKVRLGRAETTPALLINERAVGTDQDKKYVMVVNADNNAAYRPVKLGANVDGLRVVSEGLKPGDRIVVGGLQRIRPGSLVAPQPMQMAQSSCAGPASVGRKSIPCGITMNLSSFFIDRPIFAGVLSLLIFLSRAIALRALPIAEYPEVVPPSIVVRAQYPGANPKVIAETVAQPLEESINGIENMLYMGSQATTDGRSRSRSPSSSAPTPTRRSSRCRTACPRPSRACRRKCAGSASPPPRARPTSRWSCTSRRRPSATT